VSSGADPHDLARFLQAQEKNYAQALAEIRRGHKQTHWMWYIFPQFEGLGSTPRSRQYAIKSLAEAGAYLAHPVLGPRLIECAEAALHLNGRSARGIFDHPDDLKFRSSATLFAAVSAPGSVFHRIIDTYFDGAADDRTLQLIEGSRGAGAHASTAGARTSESS
jgi:uncharacterized protein (DUF1810 family)